MMGVSIPASSKLSTDALEKRLRQAISASQSLSTVISRPPIDLSRYNKWPPKSTQKTFDAIRRGNFQEAMMTFEARSKGLNGPIPLHTNTFMDIRQTLMSLARNWDKGTKWVVMQDLAQEKCGINIRVCNDEHVSR